MGIKRSGSKWARHLDEQLFRAAAEEHRERVRRALTAQPETIIHQALLRFGPVPEACQSCGKGRPTILQTETLLWLCPECAGIKP
jgi:hypothetical protein